MDVDMDNDDEDGDEEEVAGGVNQNEDEDEDEDMPAFFKELNDADAKEASKTPSRNPKSKVALVVKAKVNKVLTNTTLGEKRARQCDQNDFLKLLLGKFARDWWRRGLVLTWLGSVPRGRDSFLLRWWHILGG
jgi:18S rRNA (adenine1779-N6/adenine1780-N6)-dimethyltransferase